MQTYLRQDSETRHLMLVMTDYYNGQHERTEFTMVNLDNEPITTRGDLDGLRVHRDGLDSHYVRMPGSGARASFRTMPGERAETQRTECPRATNKRRKCNLCATER